MQPRDARTCGRITILGLLNPHEAGSSNLWFPFIEATEEQWRSIVSELIEHATAIVMQTSGLTEGVRFELQTAVAGENELILIHSVKKIPVLGRVLQWVHHSDRQDSCMAGL